jgi:hypothetical protein
MLLLLSLLRKLVWLLSLLKERVTSLERRRLALSFRVSGRVLPSLLRLFVRRHLLLGLRVGGLMGSSVVAASKELESLSCTKPGAHWKVDELFCRIMVCLQFLLMRSCNCEIEPELVVSVHQTTNRMDSTWFSFLESLWLALNSLHQIKELALS